MKKYGKTKTGRIHIFTEDNECICDSNIKMNKEVSSEYAEIFNSDKVCITCKILTHAYDEKSIKHPEIIHRMGICDNDNTCITFALTNKKDSDFIVFNGNKIQCPMCKQDVIMKVRAHD